MESEVRKPLKPRRGDNPTISMRLKQFVRNGVRGAEGQI